MKISAPGKNRAVSWGQIEIEPTYDYENWREMRISRFWKEWKERFVVERIVDTSEATVNTRGLPDGTTRFYFKSQQAAYDWIGRDKLMRKFSDKHRWTRA